MPQSSSMLVLNLPDHSSPSQFQNLRNFFSLSLDISKERGGGRLTQI